MRNVAIVTMTLVVIGLTCSVAEAGLGIGARYSFVRTEGLDDNSGSLGAFIRLKRTLVGFEAAVDAHRDHYQGSDFDVIPVTLSIMLTPLPVAHVVAGAGYYHVETVYQSMDFENETDHAIGFHYGAGVEWPVLPLLKLAGDLRYRIVDYEFDADFDGDTVRIDADGYSVGAGLILYLK